MLRMIQRVFYCDLGPKPQAVAGWDLDAREHLALWPMVALFLAMGLFSPLWMRAIDTLRRSRWPIASHPRQALPHADNPQPADDFARNSPRRRAPMNLPASVIALLPEYILTLTGVLIMLIEAVLKPGTSRKPLGWLAIAGTTAAGFISWYQLRLGVLTAFSGSIQVDAFSIFFHLLIGAVVVATLLGSLDYFDGHASHAGEYFALVLFGAVGMMLMTCSVELLMVFIGLEISSISTYILAGFRKGEGTASESSIKYFLLGSFATAFFLYGIALAFGATGSTGIAAIAAGLGASADAAHGLPGAGHDAGRPGLQGLRRALPSVDAGRLPGSARAGGRPDVHRAQGRRLRRAAAHHLLRLPADAAPLVAAAVGPGRALHDHRQPRRAEADRREAHAGLLQHRPRGLPAGRLHRVSAGGHQPPPASTPPPTPR